jgi:predicted neuraminidase
MISTISVIVTSSVCLSQKWLVLKLLGDSVAAWISFNIYRFIYASNPKYTEFIQKFMLGLL